jgi:hypothetical protein
MSHHRSTPRTVLEAPVLQPVVIHAAPGLSRAERRHMSRVPMERKLSTFGQTNTPYVKER